MNLVLRTVVPGGLKGRIPSAIAWVSELRFSCRAFWGLAVPLWLLPAPATARIDIQLLWSGHLEEAIQLDDGTPAGLTIGDLLYQAAAEVGEELRLVENVPLARALREAETSTSAVCIPMVVRTPERARFLTFSMALRPPEPVIVIHRRSDARFAAYADFDALLADRNQVLAWRASAVYSEDLRRRIATANPVMELVKSPTIQLADMVAGGRASYFIGAASTWRTLPPHTSRGGEPLAATPLPGAPMIASLHLACNAAVPARFLAATDRLIARLPR